MDDLISRQANCDYCHEDSDGYVTPLEKNCHAFVIYSPIDGWVLSMKYGAWRKDTPIRFCPMCGRELNRQHQIIARGKDMVPDLETFFEGKEDSQ